MQRIFWRWQRSCSALRSSRGRCGDRYAVRNRLRKYFPDLVRYMAKSFLSVVAISKRLSRSPTRTREADCRSRVIEYFSLDRMIGAYNGAWEAAIARPR